jgi:hypothetical protein
LFAWGFSRHNPTAEGVNDTVEALP